MKKRILIIVCCVLVVAGIGAYWLVHKPVQQTGPVVTTLPPDGV